MHKEWLAELDAELSYLKIVDHASYEQIEKGLSSVVRFSRAKTIGVIPVKQLEQGQPKSVLSAIYASRTKEITKTGRVLY